MGGGRICGTLWYTHTNVSPPQSLNTLTSLRYIYVPYVVCVLVVGTSGLAVSTVDLSYVHSTYICSNLAITL